MTEAPPMPSKLPPRWQVAPTPLLGDRGALVFILALVFALPAFFAVDWGARRIDRWMPDGEGAHTMVWLRTADVAPGDDIAIAAEAVGGYQAAVGITGVRLGSSALSVNSRDA